MSGFDLPVRAIREQVAAAIHVIVQLERASDGARRILSVEEVQGLEGDVILLQPIFRFVSHVTADGREIGQVDAVGLRPKFHDKLAATGIDLPAKIFQAPARVSPQETRPRSREVPSAAQLISRGSLPRTRR
jgi:pilus assembly protein CpaF